MDDKDVKSIVDQVVSGMAAKSRLEPHDRLVTARECDIKHGQIMNVLESQTSKMEAVHNDVKGMQKEVSETTRKINGHKAWHDGIKEEITGEHRRISVKWSKIGAIAKWVVIGILVLSTVGSLAWTVAKITSVAASIEVMNGKAKTP